MLRKIRRTLGVLCLVFVTLLFVDFTGVLHAWLGWRRFSSFRHFLP